MPVVDILSAALSGPAGRVVDGPVRNIVNEVLRDHGYASPAEVQALRDDLSTLRDQVAGLAAQVTALQSEAEALRAEAEALRSRPVAAAAPAAAAPAAAAPAAAPQAAEAERLGMSPQQYDLWKAGKLEGHVGPDGYLEIDGQAWRVDPQLEGKPYSLTRHKPPRVQVDGAVVSKTKVG